MSKKPLEKGTKISTRKEELLKWLQEMKERAPKNIRDDPVLEEWLKERRTKARRTIDAYMMGISRYVECTGMTLGELRAEAEFDQRSRLMPNETRLLHHLKQFREYLEYETDLSENTIHNRLSGVVSFYDAFYITVPDIHDNKTPKPREQNTKQIIGDEIRDALRVCDPLERALILVGVSSGLSAADITELKIKDFKAGYDEETGITTFHRFRMKRDVEFITFMTPEASASVWEYLKYRNRQPKRPSQERLAQTAKQHITSDDGWLFIVRRVSDKYLDETLPLTWQEREDLRKIDSENTYPHIFSRLAEKCQMCSIEGWNVVRSHNFRKYFSNTLLNAGVDSFFVYRMLAHKQKGSDAPYYKPDVERMKQKYIRECVELLTIQKEYDFTKSPVYKELKETKELMLAEIDRLKQENQEQIEYNAALEAEVNDAITIRDALIENLVNKRLREILLESASGIAKEKGNSSNLKVIQNMPDQEVRDLFETRSINDEKPTGEDKKETDNQNLD